MSFPILPLLEDLDECAVPATREALQKTALVGSQHLLLSTGSLIELLLRLGLRQERVCLLGKCYSQNADVISQLDRMGVSVLSGSEPGNPGTFARVIVDDARRLWSVVQKIDLSGVDTLIVLDDGGHCLDTIPADLRRRFRVVGIEQTTSGIRRTANHDKVPVISVAACAAKRYFEPPLISNAVLQRLKALVPFESTRVTIGVVGLGPIGRASVRDLIASGHPVFVHDRERRRETDVPGAVWCNAIAELLGRVDVLLGCTGDDIFRGFEWQAVPAGTTTLASCSSEDREFASLLRRGTVERGNDGSRADRSIPLGRRVWRVLRSGYPINFDGSPESVPSQEIQLTRALLAAAVLQASIMRGEVNREQRVMLDPTVQSYIVGEWLARRPERRRMYESALLDIVEDVEWFRQNSDGAPLCNALTFLDARTL